MPPENQFEQYRPLMFSLAYRMLGTRADAEDIVQDAYLRWQSASQEEVRAPKSYLTTVVARLSLDSLKSARRKRETYVGEWLPEPIVEPPGASAAEMAESLSLAFLHVLETLTPDERVAFLLREVFDADYAEIAATLDTSESNCRQLIARARKHIRDRRPRFKVDRAHQQSILQQFLLAAQTGDPSQLLPLLSAEVVLHSDGGGKVPATINPIYGADKVSRFFEGIAKKGATRGITAKLVSVNGAPGALLMHGETRSAVVSIELNDTGLVERIFFVVNPDKLPA
ncbi:MAG TPA: sigma-70 family RNA polymerase sigma factor [Bryobacteraceae bacterium]|jgi:RNA polymerase sigma-70 factor (ECF subfamily)|nr:sigma-70 family RNA polymerase sigma factor [Bryobacteraceae bacterium]